MRVEVPVSCPVALPVDAREKYALEQALVALAGRWTCGRLARPAPRTCWCLPQDGHEGRGRRVQLCWHPKNPKRLLRLPF